MKQMILGLVVTVLTSLPVLADTLRLAVTTSFHNSGLADVLLPVIKEDIDLDVQLLVVGTGQAIKLGQQGDVDAILVHSRVAEDAFVAGGFGTHRREIMYNDFVFVGPKRNDPDLASAATAREALQRINASEAMFVSRGDGSGTHAMELSLWEAAGIEPEGRWYKEAGAGMGAALNIAVGLNAYVLSDRASWLNFSNKADLAIQFEGDPVLFNQYAFLPVSRAKHPHVKSDLVSKLEEWLVSDRAETLIDGYEIDGQALFVFNAR
ncbi:substrate-binding domain-containing protein [Planktotalea sp.]|uniref:substrate-binding domain-containing protein n=1 Tax=Planktotalea sp. TaxID=2029877 RepID=UPI00329A65BD